jgi:peptide/nickel transport system permease protein
MGKRVWPLLFLAAWAASALFAPLLSPADPAATDLAHRLQGPSAAHPLGTDDLGRDVLSRLLTGGRISLAVAGVSLALALVVGSTVGLLAGYAGGWLDLLVGRLMDILLALPGILLAISIVAFVGRGYVPLVLALSATAWVAYARLARSLALSLRERDFVLASRAMGATRAGILARHLAPNAARALGAQAAAGAAGVLLSESGLSFLGLGVQPPAPSWGGLLSTGCDYLLEAPHMALCAGAILFLAVWAFNGLGEVLPEGLDPRGRERAVGL